jgi:hypothetical protein
MAKRITRSPRFPKAQANWSRVCPRRAGKPLKARASTWFISVAAFPASDLDHGKRQVGASVQEASEHFRREKAYFGCDTSPSRFLMGELPEESQHPAHFSRAQQQDGHLTAFLVGSGNLQETREDEADARGGVTGKVNRLARPQAHHAPACAQLHHLFPAELPRDVQGIEVPARGNALLAFRHRYTPDDRRSPFFAHRRREVFASEFRLRIASAAKNKSVT